MIIELTPESLFNQRTKPAVVNLHGDGRICFSVEAVKLLKLTDSTRLQFFIDSSDDEIIYFSPVTSGGFKLKENKTKQGSVRMDIYCRALLARLRKHFKYPNNKSFVITREKTSVNGHQCYFINKRKPYILKYTKQI